MASIGDSALRTSFLKTIACSLGLGIVSLPAQPASAPWRLDPPCSTEARDRAVRLAQSLRSAPPGSENWLPHPYPQTAQDAFEDFAHQFVESWSHRERGDVPPQEKHLLGLLEKPSSLRYELIPVAEWRPGRCGRICGETGQVLLLRLFEQRTGVELGRFVLHESGLLQHLNFPGNNNGLELNDGHRLEALAAGSTAARLAALDPEPQSIQYVALSSPRIECYDTVPCVAFRQGDRAFLYRTGRLFELRHQGLRTPVHGFTHDGPERERAVAQLGPQDEVVTIGEWMIAAVPIER